MRRLLFVIVIASLITNSRAQEINNEVDTTLVGGFKEDSTERILRYIVPTAGEVEKEFNLSEIKNWDLSKDYLPNTWNQNRQGLQGSCTSFAVAYIITIQKNIDNVLMRGKKEIDEFSPAYIFNYAKKKYDEPYRSNCKEGITFIDAFLIAHDNGIPEMKTYKYLPTIDGCLDKNYSSTNLADKEAHLTKIGNFQRPYIDVENFKQLLVDTPFYPICIAVYLTSEYKNARDYNRGIWEKTGRITKKVAHAMLIVGFDDSKNAFKVMDWQGSDKGDNGFIWMNYDLIANRDVVFDAYYCSHNTVNNLDPLIGARTGEAMNEFTDPDKPKSQKLLIPNSQFKNDEISFWIKSGYYSLKDSFKISCNYVNDKTNRATFRINKSDSLESLIKDDIVLTVGNSICFIDSGISYTLKLVEIANRGNNILKKAAVLLFTRNSPCSIESHPNSNNEFKNDIISFWIKSGYYATKDNFKISCSSVNDQTKKATFTINTIDSNNVIGNNIVLDNGGSFCFSDNGVDYKLTLVEIANRGNNVFKKAAVLRFARNDTCSK